MQGSTIRFLHSVRKRRCSFFENLPLSKILDIAFLFAAFLFIVTLCDSMTRVTVSIMLKGEGPADEESPGWSKIFRSVLMVSLAFMNIFVAGVTDNTSGINVTKLPDITCALPVLYRLCL